MRVFCFCHRKLNGSLGMVYLAITHRGLLEAIDRAKLNGSVVWCGSDAISEEMFDRLEAGNVTRFAYPLGRENEAVIADAKEHHPGENIWVERSSTA